MRFHRPANSIKPGSIPLLIRFGQSNGLQFKKINPLTTRFNFNRVEIIDFCALTLIFSFIFGVNFILLKLIGFNEKYNKIEESETKENSKPSNNCTPGKVAKQNETKANEITTMKSPLMQIKQLIKVLSTPFFDGRILLTLDQSTRSTLKYILMNPSICFEEIASQARSVILAGGTMKPV